MKKFFGAALLSASLAVLGCDAEMPTTEPDAAPEVTMPGDTLTEPDTDAAPAETEVTPETDADTETVPQE